MRYFLITVALLSSLACKFEHGPVEPSSVAAVSISPSLWHMKLGDSETFTASGGDGRAYNFILSIYATGFFNMEITGNKAKLTYIKSANVYSTSLTVYSGGNSNSAVIFFDN